ncbi:MAG TPA: YggT family protein [Dehalococcoidia bacterium]
MIGLIVSYVAYVLAILIFIRALLSWVPNLNPRNPLIEALIQVTEPILSPIRSIMPRSMFDFSPMVASLVLLMIARVASGGA